MGMIRAKDLQAVLGKPRARVLGIATASAMNRTEQAYAAHLETRRVAGEVLMYSFEAVRLRLADRTYYVPDFLVWLPDGSVEVHEVKGFWQDDARVKIKVAAEHFPMFAFVAVRKQRGGWDYEHFKTGKVWR